MGGEDGHSTPVIHGGGRGRGRGSGRGKSRYFKKVITIQNTLFVMFFSSHQPLRFLLVFDLG